MNEQERWETSKVRVDLGLNILSLGKCVINWTDVYLLDSQEARDGIVLG